MGLFGAAPSPFGDPLIESQVVVNQFLSTLRLTAMEYGKQIGQVNALTGRQISSAKLQLTGSLLLNKNQIKTAQADAKVQGVDIDQCVDEYNGAASLINVKSLKKCANTQEIFKAKLNMLKLKDLQNKAKTTVATCQLQYPDPTQTADVNTCVSDGVDALQEQLTTVNNENTNLLNEASQSTCVQDTQSVLQESIQDTITNFQNCVLEVPAVV